MSNNKQLKPDLGKQSINTSNDCECTPEIAIVAAMMSLNFVYANQTIKNIVQNDEDLLTHLLILFRAVKVLNLHFFPNADLSNELKK